MEIFILHALSLGLLITFARDLLKLNQLLVPPLQGLLKYFDSYVDKKIIADGFTNYEKDKFVNKIYNHHSCHNRLIVYSPLDQFDVNDQYNWDNWHTDFGLLATVVHPIYFNKQGEPYSLDHTCFVLRDRLGNEHQGIFHENEFMITAGDAMFIESSGYIPATPHTVRIEQEMPTSIYRVQSVSFFEPYLNYQMNIPTKECFSTIIKRNPYNHDYSGVNNFQEGCYYKTFLDDLLDFLYR